MTRDCGLELGLGFKTHRILLGDEEVWGVRLGSFMKPGGWVGGSRTSSWDPVGRRWAPQKGGKSLRLFFAVGPHAYMLQMEKDAWALF